MQIPSATASRTAAPTASSFGAAAAAGKLLGLDEEKMVWALGLAGTLSFGTWAFLIDGILKLRENYQLPAADIDHIQIHTYSVGYKQCKAAPGSREPKTVVNARFSSPFVAACAIVRGEVTLREMKEEIIQDPEIQDLLHKVQVKPDPAFTEAYPEHWGCRVQIYTKDGAMREALVPDASGSTARPLTEKQVKDKAVSLMEETVKELAEAYADRILKIQEAPCMPAL